MIEEMRLAGANVVAHANVMNAREGDYVDVLLSDGMVERWQYICGGTFCAGTIINVAPVHSMCNGDWNWVPFADWEPPAP
ncbi:MAG TPA: hypothetical protein VLF18_19185 [Tahibacter sp.]|uniref:hypothetical protein n=1 Tax=Tahibacter sp. TaxID=2056211 RepID=UPI002CFF8294|nr:hypothetical protein [Tahibacter sp.]HSX62314.1 hypothetical protein [Tahibacter sp.]